MSLFIRRSLLSQIEAGALNAKSDLASVLRMCVALGGRSGSSELSDWARKELNGYSGDGDVPSYRWLNAPLQIDAIEGGRHLYRRKQISTWDLPDFAQETWKEGLRLTFGVGELQRLAKRTGVVDLQPDGMADVMYFMNNHGSYNMVIQRLYFAVQPDAIHGVLDNIRTTLVGLVAEMRTAGVSSKGVPSQKAADQAVQIIVKGRARPTINTAVGDGATASMTVQTSHDTEARIPGWIRGPWGFTIGAATILSGIAVVVAWLH
ncbi:MAG: hypothetical protein ACJ72L_18625 [Marmoricola sp.]